MNQTNDVHFQSIILLYCMDSVNAFIENNKNKVDEVYDNSAQEGEIPANNLYNFLRDIFSIEQIRFLRKGKDYFKEQDNQGHTQKMIQEYYKTTLNGNKAKFYLYKISFDFQDIRDFVKYWLSVDKSITVEYPRMNQQHLQSNQAQQFNTLQHKDLASSDLLRESMILQNQFLHDEQRIPLIRQAYQREISALEEMLMKVASNSQQYISINRKIEQYKKKLQELEPKKPNQNNQAQQKQAANNSKSKTQTSRARKQVNLKQLFQFYAKQNHLTGLKASFDRIQHESQTINYQKLVYFLKEYDIFPQKPKNQKKLHNLYVRVCSSTRDLHYSDFIQLIQKLPQIIFDGPETAQAKKELLMAKIQSKQQKNKLLHNPFHSPQRNNFRIDSHEIKYSFKLKPLQGKLQQEVNNQLQSRRKQKQLAKQQSAKTKEQKLLNKLKKLSSIDPYHPLVVKNAQLLEKRSPSVTMEPVANLENMQKFRDANFNMKAHFGISDFQQDPLKQISKRYESNKRAQLMQKEQSERMSIMMNGIIERSDAKISKFTSSPKKRQISSKIS